MSKEDDANVSALIHVINNAVLATIRAKGPIDEGDLVSALLNMLAHHLILIGCDCEDSMSWLAQAYAMQWKQGSRPKAQAAADT